MTEREQMVDEIIKRLLSEKSGTVAIFANETILFIAQEFKAGQETIDYMFDFHTKNFQEFNFSLDHYCNAIKLLSLKPSLEKVEKLLEALLKKENAFTMSKAVMLARYLNRTLNKVEVKVLMKGYLTHMQQEDLAGEDQILNLAQQTGFSEIELDNFQSKLATKKYQLSCETE